VIAGSDDLGFARGARSLEPVCLEDIMPTVLELAGAELTKKVDGRSLVPTLKTPGTAVRPWLHSEHGPTYSPQQAFQSINDGRMKYIWRPHDGSEQLFDLVNDPQEKVDLAGQPAHRAARDRLQAILAKRLEKRAEGFSDGRTLIAGRPYRSLTTPVPP
jgi:arylsulfatase A-like enzyme